MAMTRAKKVLLSVAVVLVALAGTVIIVPPLLWGDGVDYSRVASIKTTREYQDPALLAKAWALPAAAKYKKEVDFQHNGSFCGPTSIVNVMHSLGLGGDQGTVLAGTDVSTFLGFLPGGITLDSTGRGGAAKAWQECLGDPRPRPSRLSRAARLRQRSDPQVHHQLHARPALRHRRRAPFASRGLSQRRGSGVRARREQEIWSLVGETRSSLRSYEHGRSQLREKAWSSANSPRRALTSTRDALASPRPEGRRARGPAELLHVQRLE